MKTNPMPYYDATDRYEYRKQEEKAPFLTMVFGTHIDRDWETIRR